jgi:hypothetical protein
MAHEGEQTTIRLLICDDHKVLTDALALIVGSDPDIQLVADPVQDPTGSVRSSSTWPPAIANEAIGSDLFISPRTVQTHVRNIVR